MRSPHFLLRLCTAAFLCFAVPGGLSRPAEMAAHTGAVLQAGEQPAPLTVDETMRLVRQGAVVLIDIRPPADFERAHLPGAISVPMDELAARVDQLRANGRTVIVYCCGKPWSVESARAAATLRDLGVRDVHALKGGFQRWVDAGYVVVVPPSA